MSKGYEIKAQDKSAEILIYDEIGPWGVEASQFAKDLKNLGNIETINLRLNSPGGQVFDAHAIFNMLVRSKARVEVDIDGMALSAASVIAMAGDEIRMAENAMMMIHDPWIVAMGSAQELRNTADTLDKIRGTIVSTYSGRRALDAEEVSKMMADETWMDAGEALDAGFVDSVTQAQRAAAHYDPSHFPFLKADKLQPIEEENNVVEMPGLKAAAQASSKLQTLVNRVKAVRSRTE